MSANLNPMGLNTTGGWQGNYQQPSVGNPVKCVGSGGLNSDGVPSVTRGADVMQLSSAARGVYTQPGAPPAAAVTGRGPVAGITTLTSQYE